MSPHDIATELAQQSKGKSLNEADTRHQIIDRLLHDVLAWPRNAVSCEKHVHEGYMDYVLSDPASRAILVIEAKREGKSFTLPASVIKKSASLSKVRLKTLATVPAIKSAINQVVQYCPQVGSEHACITNGHAYIFFRPYIKGRSLFDADALVVPSLEYFASSFIEAEALFSYTALAKSRSLARALDERGSVSRELFQPKDGINHYDAPISQNKYAKFIHPIARRYFEDIMPNDPKMMNSCYVYADGSKQVQDGLTARLQDKLTPYFEGDGGAEIKSKRHGGSLTQRIAQSLSTEKGDVLILFGGKGAGKSTFLRRVLYFDPPPELQIHSFPIIIDFLQAPQDVGAILQYVWETIVKALDQEDILSRDIEELGKLFAERLEIANRQELSAYGKGTQEYYQARNALITDWRSDLNYVASRLQEYWKKLGKGLVITFDNTDQLPPKLQDHCFLVAQNISRDLSCVAIISMREERYCRARTLGVLDAYHNSGFHLASPDLTLVFTKRLNLVINDLMNQNTDSLRGILPEGAPYSDLARFFIVCVKQFKNEGNDLGTFLSACSHDNTRLALQFFRQFITSGYTNAEEFITNPGWTVIAHQVIKPMMIPERYNYDETKSMIPNIFQCRRLVQGSHFTGLRLLGRLRGSVSANVENAGYIRVDVLCDDFDVKFGMREDCETWIDILLRYGLVEANNRLDSYSVETAGDRSELIFADEVRITAFGAYLFDDLCRTFSYFELVSLDCGLAKESLYNDFCNAAVEERRFGQKTDKLSRLKSRLQRTKKFIEYLRAEEEREIEQFMLTDAERLMGPIMQDYETDLKRVENSANRNVGRVHESD